MEDWTPEQAYRHYRGLAARNRKLAGELLAQGIDNQLTRDAVAALFQDARDNEDIANSFADKIEEPLS